MGLDISNLSGSVSTTRPGSNARASVGSFDNRLSVAQIASTKADDSTTSISAEARASRSFSTQLSAAVSSLTTRESVTQGQLDTVNSLLERARSIKSESNTGYADQYAAEATSLINASETGYENTISSDASLEQDSTVAVSESTAGEKGFSTTLGGTQTLESLGVSSSLSFEKADIDSTIETLEGAQSALRNKLDSYGSSRANITSEVSVRSSAAGTVAAASGKKSIEEIAADLAKKITSSTESLVAAGKVDQLDVESLLSQGEATIAA